MKLNEYGIFEYSKNGHSLDTLPRILSTPPFFLQCMIRFVLGAMQGAFTMVSEKSDICILISTLEISYTQDNHLRIIVTI